jgi:DNA-binding MarR family transcriptional regulator
MTLTDEVRAFNRFYTREIGLLNRSLPATDLSLPEARVLYELAQAPEGGRTAAEIGRTLDMDKAHLSRIVTRFLGRGLASSRVSPNHRKHRLISLADAGRKVFAGAEAAARGQVDALLEPIDAAGRNRIVEAMRDIRMALRDREAADGEVRLRPLRPAGSSIARRSFTLGNTAGIGLTRGSPAAFSGPSSPNSIPPAKTAGSPSAAGRPSARFS